MPILLALLALVLAGFALLLFSSEAEASVPEVNEIPRPGIFESLTQTVADIPDTVIGFMSDYIPIGIPEYVDNSVNTFPTYEYGVVMDGDANLLAFLALIRKVEANNRYDVIAGNDTFSDFSEHPFIINPARRRPLGTTASGAYQMVKGTWTMARDALGLTDFSPASQDAAALWILEFKRPKAYPLIVRGNFDLAIAALRSEWEAFDKMIKGTYPISLNQSRIIYADNGGTIV